MEDIHLFISTFNEINPNDMALIVEKTNKVLMNSSVPVIGQEQAYATIDAFLAIVRLKNSSLKVVK